MATLDRAELDRLERRELQLTILAVVFVLVLAGGLAVFMYPQNYFWDRLTMEFRRAITMQKNLSLLLAKARASAVRNAQPGWKIS